MRNYDYTKQGAYYVTLCTNDRTCVFGDVRNRQMALNDAGRMIDTWWQRLSDKYDGITIDQYCIMPNHVHGIINIVGHRGINCVGADPRVCPELSGRTHVCAPTSTIGTMIQWLKTMSTNEYIRNVKRNHWQAFNKHLWQRNYYEHIIRNDIELNRIRQYIVENPLQWEIDSENPNHQATAQITKGIFLPAPQ